MQKFEKARFNWKLSFICRKEFFHIISTRCKIFSSIIYWLCCTSQLRVFEFRIWTKCDETINYVDKNGNVIELVRSIMEMFRVHFVWLVWFVEHFVHNLELFFVSDNLDGKLRGQVVACFRQTYTKSNIIISICSFRTRLCDLERKKMVQIKECFFLRLLVKWNLMCAELESFEARSSWNTFSRFTERKIQKNLLRVTNIWL